MTTFRLCPGCAGALVAAACAALLGGCVTLPRDPAARAELKAQNDPLEPLNRKAFAFNEFVDRVAAKPVARTYVKVVPRPARDALRHVLDNLDEPAVLVNNLLQGQFKRAGISAARFLINTVTGPVGLRDVAGRGGLARQSGDFGQTLYVWGFGDGPYLMLPLVGPSNPRDAIGQGVDVFLDPCWYVAHHEESPAVDTTSRDVASGIDERARNLDTLDELQRTSIDFYAALRSYFRQNRSAELRHGGPPPSPADFYEDPDAAPPPARDAAGGAISR